MVPVNKLIATSVVRGTQQGESHGGVYLIDLENRKVVQTIDWNTADIDWQGRGWDRGLRGIAIDGEHVCIAASDELFIYTPEFELVGSFRNPYLRHCHEIYRYERRLFLTSTGFDAMLGFDLDEMRFCWGLHLSQNGHEFRGSPFDPNTTEGPMPGNRLHINNVFCNHNGMYLSGLKTDGLLLFNGKTITRSVTLPGGIHNARPFRNGVIFNDTEADMVRYVTPDSQLAFRVPRYDEQELTHTGLDSSRIARQAFGRGLCQLDESVIATGSSPSTITLHDIDKRTSIRKITLSLDVRNAIHGLEPWPF